MQHRSRQIPWVPGLSVRVAHCNTPRRLFSNGGSTGLRPSVGNTIARKGDATPAAAAIWAISDFWVISWVPAAAPRIPKQEWQWSGGVFTPTPRTTTFRINLRDTRDISLGFAVLGR
jgi:hypothetical protein